MSDAAVYLDHAASTPLREAAREALRDVEGVAAANASGAHRAARRARAAIDDAREALAGVLGADPGDIVFTSGGTESDNLAVLGRHAAVGGRVLCSAVEHPAVLEATHLVDGKTVGTDERGVVDLDALTAILDADVSLVSVMTVNNEVGVVQPVAEIAELVRRSAPSALVHTDAVQALNWVDLRSVTPHVDLLSLSAHKFGGPQGVGLCVVRRGAEVAARQVGGGQERERRSGTSNVAGIVAMAAAAVDADASRAEEVVRLASLRDRLVQLVTTGLDGDVVRTGVARESRSDGDAHIAAGFAHFCFAGVDSEALLFLLDDADVYASAGSACASGAQHPSHVLEAMGIGHDLAAGSLRLTLGHTTTADDVDRAAAAVVAAVARLRRYPR
ncbi:MAG: aminotransferase class V-fold PLP-dependent enzyme [Acidimicrobiales bacterium]